ncbi:MAG: hypothetical protein P8H40_03820 [Winogradskyella sp.]|nr:hypothetical protein [Winogradskyella sp.]
MSDQLLRIENLMIQPTLYEKELANQYVHSREIYRVAVDTLEISDFSFFKNQEIIASSIALAGFDLAIYKDKSKPQNRFKIIQLPQISLKQTNSPINIGKINFKDSKISIKERIAHKDTTMQFFVNNLNCQILNISNHKFNNPNINVSVTGKLMGEAPINLTIKALLTTNNNNLYWEGRIGSLKFRTLDKVLYPVLGLKILSGELNRIDFKAVSNDIESKGEMTMLYKSLHASVLKSHTSNENHFLTSIANGLIHKSNPNKRGKIKSVRMYYKRDQHKGLSQFFL